MKIEERFVYCVGFVEDEFELWRHLQGELREVYSSKSFFFYQYLSTRYEIVI